MQKHEPYVNADLVLIGGGHSHLFVLRHLAMHPLPGVRVTLVTRDLHTPYSGMLPGLIAGHYDHDEAHIDLLPLARYAGARVIHEAVCGIDAAARQISLKGRPPLAYDLLSINIGSRPSTPLVVDTGGQQFAIKPVDRFLDSWQRLEQQLEGREQDFHLAIIGGGAGGVELALALDHRAHQPTRNGAKLKICILSDRDRLLPGHNSRVQGHIVNILQQRSIPVYLEHRVTGLEGGLLQGAFTSTLAADAAIWVTHAQPAEWLQDSGLKLDQQGFIAVNAGLQSVSHKDVFAAGDIAAVSAHPRPKSGVFAVRQGLPLARNLVRSLQGQDPVNFSPQMNFLSLISTGDRHAIASRGRWALQGKWCWWLKDRIDRNFMRRFTELPGMRETESAESEFTPMRCGGCGSKVGSQVLEQVLDQLGRQYGDIADSGLQHPDDAALIEVPPGKQLVQSVDHFRSFIDDPYLFGKVATNHALGDLFAMGVDAHSALVVANVVYGSEARQSGDLYQLMSGVVETLALHETRLVGGHSGEAIQMNCGLSVNGFASKDELMLKSGAQTGDRLILTKPLGSGVLFAADMRGEARGSWLDIALENMLVSSRDAGRCLRRFNVRACTDVTGFGLAGHLYEMMRASTRAVELYVDRLPLYPGAAELAHRGIESSLKPQNLRIRHSILDQQDIARHASYPLLFDPQTAGGLLASVPAAQAEACLEQLHMLGYGEARIIGRVVDTTDSGQLISLVKS